MKTPGRAINITVGIKYWSSDLDCRDFSCNIRYRENYVNVIKSNSHYQELMHYKNAIHCYIGELFNIVP